MATFDVLRRAAAAGRNFVITHEPTFYNHMDQTADLEQDPIYQAKQRFIKDNNLVVFRFHDHAHALQPDPLVAGSARMLGWTQYASPDRAAHVRPADDDASRAGRRRGGEAQGTRDPCRRRSGYEGDPGRAGPRLRRSRADASIDVAVGGETAESGGNAEYIMDAAADGQKKGMILLGHMMSEDWGMREVAEWLRPLVPEVTVEWMPAGEPFTMAK